MFAAAARQGWELTVVCGRRDLARVQELNQGGTARVLCEIDQVEHERLLRGAAVFVIPIRDGAPSAGQVRLMDATDAGTPIVVSRVPALAEYVDDESTLLVTPGDADALRSAVDLLLDSAELRDRLIAARAEAARGSTYHDYFSAIGRLVDSGA
jgi:glycosyltransferase involved in cell wall biosynthesis